MLLQKLEDEVDGRQQNLSPSTASPSHDYDYNPVSGGFRLQGGGLVASLVYGLKARATTVQNPEAQNRADKHRNKDVATMVGTKGQTSSTDL